MSQIVRSLKLHSNCFTMEDLGGRAELLFIDESRDIQSPYPCLKHRLADQLSAFYCRIMSLTVNIGALYRVITFVSASSMSPIQVSQMAW